MADEATTAREDAPATLVIASRESALALWQARHIQQQLAALYPRCQVSILGMTTQGDRMLGVPLAAIGGKGLFVKELETALAERRADIAVHSMKDVPMHLPDEFAIAAIAEREDPRDAFVSNLYRGLEAMPAGCRVGTSSLRRESQLRARFPQLEVGPVRGNVHTRLKKLDAGDYAAIILAAAGLKRLGLAGRITALLSPEQSLPAPGQGALGVECLAQRRDLLEWLAPLEHHDTAMCVRAERAFSRALAGNCNVPLGAFAQMAPEGLRLRGFVASRDGALMVSGQTDGAEAQAEMIGTRLAEQLRTQGADEILALIETP